MTAEAKRRTNEIGKYTLILTSVGIFLTSWFNWRQQSANETKTLNDKLDRILIIGQALNDHVVSDGDIHANLESRVKTIEAYFIQADKPTVGRRIKQHQSMFMQE